MKKKILGIISCFTFIFISGCGASDDVTAAQIVSELQKAGYPIDNVQEYTESSDPNQLLGRPNQYIQKINFADMRFVQSDSSDPVGGSIEIFENSSDCEKRAEYISSVSEALPVMTEYAYQFDNILLRLPKIMLPVDAENYEDSVAKIIDGKTPDDFVLDDSFIMGCTVFPVDNVSQEQLSNIEKAINSFEIIPGSCKFVSSEETASDFADEYFANTPELKEEFLSTLPSLLSSCFEFRVLVGYADQVKTELKYVDGVQQVNIDSSVSEP